MLAFACAYGGAMGVAAVPGALWLRGSVDSRLGLALLFFAAGAFVAGLLAALTLRLWGRRRARSARFAAAIIVLAILTVGFDAFIYYVHTASYFGKWWATPFSFHWFVTVVFTGGGALFYFMTIALPMILPLGLPVLLAGAAILSRPPAPDGAAFLSPAPAPAKMAAVSRGRPVP